MMKIKLNNLFNFPLDLFHYSLTESFTLPWISFLLLLHTHVNLVAKKRRRKTWKHVWHRNVHGMVNERKKIRKRSLWSLLKLGQTLFHILNFSSFFSPPHTCQRRKKVSFYYCKKRGKKLFFTWTHIIFIIWFLGQSLLLFFFFLLRLRFQGCWNEMKWNIFKFHANTFIWFIVHVINNDRCVPFYVLLCLFFFFFFFIITLLLLPLLAALTPHIK